MVLTYEGNLNGQGLRVAVVVAKFNELITERLLEGALNALRRHGVDDASISVAKVPGSFEVPAVAKRFARSGDFDAVVCLGAVIRGATSHFDHVAGQAAGGIASLALDCDIPVIFGILTTENTEQAMDRAGIKLGNKGFEAAVAAIETADLMRQLPKPV
jgi:6,7-dimethyl-8-ribityllumazine synthase